MVVTQAGYDAIVSLAACSSRVGSLCLVTTGLSRLFRIVGMPRASIGKIKPDGERAARSTGKFVSPTNPRATCMKQGRFLRRLLTSRLSTRLLSGHPSSSRIYLS
nr:Biomphalaria glabrata colorectal mutant cancer protein-like [Biomphalaria glabrata]